MTITLEQANAIVAGALGRAAELKLKPLSVAVLDAGGHLVAFQRQDGSSLMRFQIANGKASGALALGVSSRKVAEMASERPSFIAALNSIASAGVVPAPGGLLVTDTAGTVIGAVGISGDVSDNDEACALAGVVAAGLSAGV
jgi:uncharacterized protein GlcG (DUF336 family)